MIEQLDCYTGASIQYSYNVRTADLALTPNVEAECMFPSEVQIEIIFHDGIASQSYVYNEFSFPNTTTIILQNIEISEDVSVKFAYLNISSLSRYTLVKVDSFGIQTSLMDRCFDATTDHFLLDADRYYFNVTLTDACYDEIMQSDSYQISFGAYAATESIDIADNLVCWLSEEDEYLLHCEVLADFGQQIQEPFLAMNVIFSMTIAGIEYTASHTFSNVQYGPYSLIYKSNNRLSVSKSTVFVYGMADTYIAYYLENFVRGSDKVALRFMIKQKRDSSITMLQFELPDMYVLRYAFIFYCKDDACQALNYLVMSHPEQYYFAFDAAFFKGDSFSTILYQDLTPIVSCFESTVAKQIGQKFRFEVVAGGKCHLDLNKPMQFTIAGIDNLLPNPMLFTVVVELDSFNGTYTFDCGGLAACEPANLRRDSVGIMLKFEQGELIDYVYNTQFVNGDYKTVQAATFSVAIFIVLGCVWDSINKIMLFKRVMRANKVSRR